MAQLRLKDQLVNFLRNDVSTVIPKLDVRIIQDNPMMITDDYERIMQIHELEAKIKAELNGQEGKNFKVTLQDCSFVIAKTATGADYYLDLTAKTIVFKKDSFILEPEEKPIRMEEDTEIRYLFERKKRSLVEGALRGNRNASVTKDSVKEASAKNTLSTMPTEPKESPMPKESPLPIENVLAFDAAQTQSLLKLSKEILVKGSTNKTADTGKQNPLYPKSSFFRHSGIQSANMKYSAEELNIITIQDILRVPVYVPEVKRSVIRFTPAVFRRMKLQTESVERDLDLLQKESIERMGMRYSYGLQSRDRYSFGKSNDKSVEKTSGERESRDKTSGERLSSGDNGSRDRTSGDKASRERPSGDRSRSGEDCNAIDFQELNQHLKEGTIKWGDLVFSRKTLEYVVDHQTKFNLHD
jgi:hypothetical protein